MPAAIIVTVVSCALAGVWWLRRPGMVPENAPHGVSSISRVSKLAVYGQPRQSTDRSCPYCGHEFKAVLMCSRNCPACKAYVVLSRTLDGKVVLLTEAQADGYQAFVQPEREQQGKDKARLHAIEAMRSFYPLSEYLYKDYEQQLHAKWGVTPTPADVFWAAANGRLAEELKRSNHEVLAAIYWQMAWHLHQQQKDCRELQKEYFHHRACWLRERSKASAKYGLRCAGVKVLPSKECHAARQLPVQCYSFREFQKESPLPYTDCDRGWCNCTIDAYYPELEPVREKEKVS